MSLRVWSSVVNQVRAPASPAFGLAIWVGSIGGAALPTDPDPNVTPPSAGRIVRVQAKRGGAFVLGRTNQTALVNVTIVFGVVAASSITVQLWFFDATQAKWVPMGIPATRTPTGAATNLFGAVTETWFPVGAQFFPQITANVNTQAMAYDAT
jgi:hypothetical protein